MTRNRWIPLSGIVFVVLVLLDVAAFSSGTPSASSSGSKVATYYNAHQGREVFAAFLFAASAPFLALFGVQLASALRKSGATSDVWRWLLAIGTAVAAAMVLLTALIHFALADSANHLAGDGIRALNYLDNDGWIAWNSALGIMMLGAAGLVLGAQRLLPRWFGWIALAVGILLFIPFADFIALLVTLLWIIVVSVMLWRADELWRADAPPVRVAAAHPASAS